MLAAAQQRGQFVALGLAQFDPVTYIHRRPLVEGTRDESHDRHLSSSFRSQIYAKAGAVSRFHLRLHQVLGRPPAEADLQRHFRVSPPSVHQMVLTLERAGLIRRTVGGPRSIEILVDPEALPVLRPAQEQPVKSSVQRYRVNPALLFVYAVCFFLPRVS